MRIISTHDCKVETSSLTGESLPVTCSLYPAGGNAPAPASSPSSSPSEQATKDGYGKEEIIKLEQARNVCFNSSKCLEGER
jgi:magnesium-transporting ATPase (P-type)